MNIVICGAGEVGRHAAEVLSEDANDITIVDQSEDRLTQIEDRMDVRSVVGSGTDAATLIEAGCKRADLFIAATNVDEVNLLASSVAKGLGTAKCVARVHHHAYFDGGGLDYAKHLRIDHLVCPEYSTARAVVSVLRSPGALAIESIAHGRIEMQQLPVSQDAKAVGQTLRDLQLPGSARLAAIDRSGAVFLPDAQTIVQSDDIVTLVGDADGFDRVRKLFHTEDERRRRVVIAGGSGQAVWLSRALRHRGFSIRLLEADPVRARTLAEKLDWVTVLNVDTIDTDALREEHVEDADAFVAVSLDDEENILSAAWAKSVGVDTAIAILQRGTYLHLIDYVGIDRAFSPRLTAVAEIQRLLEAGPMRKLTSLSEGELDVFEVRVSPTADGDFIGRPLREVKLPPHTLIAAVQRHETDVFVPGGDSMILRGDTVVIIADPAARKPLRRMFG